MDGIRLDTTPHMRYDFLKEIQDGDRRCKLCGALGRNNTQHRMFFILMMRKHMNFKVHEMLIDGHRKDQR